MNEDQDASSVPVGGQTGKRTVRASLNLCSGCNRNFAGTSAHALHRVGKFQPDERRCLTSDEMLARGFTVGVEPVKRTREGVDYTEMMETWHEPKSEKQLASLANLRKGGSSVAGMAQEDE